MEKGKKLKIAIAYDFDGTLAPGNMQEHSFIPDIGMKNSEFWENVRKIAEKNEMDEILAYMFFMLKKAKEKDIQIKKDNFKKHGQGLKLFNGVEEYFAQINQYATDKHIEIEHYIISSGLEDILAGVSLSGVSIFKLFKKIFASAFKYDINGVAEWPAIAIDYTSKTQFLFRINKGIDSRWENDKINKFMKEDERHIPFKRMIYIGDGETDIPAMKMVMSQGGTAIAVYNNKNKKQKAKQTCEKLIEENRANFMAAADYSQNKDLYKIIQLSIDKIAVENQLLEYKK